MQFMQKKKLKKRTFFGLFPFIIGANRFVVAVLTSSLNKLKVFDADFPSLPFKRKVFNFSCFSRKPSAFPLYFENLPVFTDFIWIVIYIYILKQYSPIDVSPFFQFWD